MPTRCLARKASQPQFTWPHVLYVHHTSVNRSVGSPFAAVESACRPVFREHDNQPWTSSLPASLAAVPDLVRVV
eukprot:6210900-Pleurochrysis_carterae.AAC.2